MWKKNKRTLINIVSQSGFTLVELMITLMISGIIVAAIYSAYLAQQRTYLAQDQVAEMQQNIRAALDILARETRMAGFDLTGSAGAGITNATSLQIDFTLDSNSDGDFGDSEENLTYALYVGGDGIQKLGRRDNNDVAPAFQAVAENFDAIEFQYLDETGAVTAVLGKISSLQVSLLARAGRPDPNFTNTATYTPASGTPWDLNGAVAGNAANDNLRRRMLITTIQCRNLGL